jgi:hypothetical protein
MKTATGTEIIDKTNYWFFEKTMKIILGTEKGKHSKILDEIIDFWKYIIKP